MQLENVQSIQLFSSSQLCIHHIHDLGAELCGNSFLQLGIFLKIENDYFFSFAAGNYTAQKSGWKQQVVNRNERFPNTFQIIFLYAY